MPARWTKEPPAGSDAWLEGRMGRFAVHGVAEEPCSGERSYGNGLGRALAKRPEGSRAVVEHRFPV